MSAAAQSSASRHAGFWIISATGVPARRSWSARKDTASSSNPPKKALGPPCDEPSGAQPATPFPGADRAMSRQYRRRKGSHGRQEDEAQRQATARAERQ